MNEEEIKVKLRKIVADALGMEPEKIRLDGNFQTEYFIDSLGWQEVFLDIRDELGVDLEPDHYPETYAGLESYVVGIMK